MREEKSAHSTRAPSQPEIEQVFLVPIEPFAAGEPARRPQLWPFTWGCTAKASPRAGQVLPCCCVVLALAVKGGARCFSSRCRFPIEPNRPDTPAPAGTDPTVEMDKKCYLLRKRSYKSVYAELTKDGREFAR